MSGYCGLSMSWNAIDAYERNAMPISKWSKKTILEELEDYADEATYKRLSKLSLKTLQDNFLAYDSWHHTGACYNETDFYTFEYPDSLDVDSICKADQITTAKEREKRKIAKEANIAAKKNISYIFFKVEERYGPSDRDVTVYSGQGILAGRYCYVVKYNGYKVGGKKCIYSLDFWYDHQKVYKKKPKEFDTKATHAVMKKYKLGKYCK